MLFKQNGQTLVDMIKENISRHEILMMNPQIAHKVHVINQQIVLIANQ